MKNREDFLDEAIAELCKFGIFKNALSLYSSAFIDLIISFILFFG
jgi:hypothetical protein